jgi:hypothetical protein
MHLKSVLLRGVALGRRGFIRGELLYKIVFITEITGQKSCSSKWKTWMQKQQQCKQKAKHKKEEYIIVTRLSVIVVEDSECL